MMADVGKLQISGLTVGLAHQYFPMIPNLALAYRTPVISPMCLSVFITQYAYIFLYVYGRMWIDK